MKKLLLAVVALAVVAGGCYIVTADGEVISLVPTVVVPARVVVAAPTMSYIPGTQIRIMKAALGDVFQLNGVYWRYRNGSWWRSSKWNAGWSVAGTVPRAFLRIPATHRAHRVVKTHPLFKKPVPKVKLPAAKPPVVKRPAVKRPAVKRPAVKKPVVRRPAVRRPAIKKPAGKKPAGKPASKEKKEKKEKKSKKSK